MIYPSCLLKVTQINRVGNASKKRCLLVVNELIYSLPTLFSKMKRILKPLNALDIEKLFFETLFKCWVKSPKLKTFSQKCYNILIHH